MATETNTPLPPETSPLIGELARLWSQPLGIVTGYSVSDPSEKVITLLHDWRDEDTETYWHMGTRIISRDVCAVETLTAADCEDLADALEQVEYDLFMTNDGTEYETLEALMLELRKLVYPK